MFNINFADDCRPLVLEATALPTVQQPLPNEDKNYSGINGVAGYLFSCGLLPIKDTSALKASTRHLSS